MEFCSGLVLVVKDMIVVVSWLVVSSRLENFGLLSKLLGSIVKLGKFSLVVDVVFNVVDDACVVCPSGSDDFGFV